MRGRTQGAIAVCASALALGAVSRGYRNIAEIAGIDFRLVSGGPGKHFIIESMAGGVALIDYNNDGLSDIYLASGSTIEAELNGNNSSTDRLYRNNGDGTFTDVTRQTQVGDERWTMGVAIADVNNDGFDDIYLTNYGRNRLYLNNGQGTFRDGSRDSGLDLDGWSAAAAFADYDRDGDLDVYVSQYLDFDIRNLPGESLLCRYRDIPVQCGPRGLKPARGHLFENTGGGRFRNVSDASGIAAAEPSYGMGAVWGDYDRDGNIDLYVGNDSLPNYLFRNLGNKKFEEVALTSGVALRDDGREQATMGVDFGDYDNDGDLDLIGTNFSEDYTILYRNNGKGTFSDVSAIAGLIKPTWLLLKWGVQFADMNNDGWLDIVQANGHVYPQVDQHDLGTTYRQALSLFINLKNGKFKDSSVEQGPAFQAKESSRGLATGDLNNDGAQDIVVQNLDARPWVIMNPGPAGHWLLIHLKGSVSNRNGVGARVTAKAGTLQQTREVKSGGSYQSHSDFRVHFGFGPADIIDELRIEWPSGAVQTLHKVKTDHILKLDEPRTAAR